MPGDILLDRFPPRRQRDLSPLSRGHVQNVRSNWIKFRDRELENAGLFPSQISLDRIEHAKKEIRKLERQLEKGSAALSVSRVIAKIAEAPKGLAASAQSRPRNSHGHASEAADSSELPVPIVSRHRLSQILLAKSASTRPEMSCEDHFNYTPKEGTTRVSKPPVSPLREPSVGQSDSGIEQSAGDAADTSEIRTTDDAAVFQESGQDCHDKSPVSEPMVENSPASDGQSPSPDLEFVEDSVLSSRTKSAAVEEDAVHIKEEEPSFSHLDISQPSQVLHVSRRAYVNSQDQSFDSDGDFMEDGEQNEGPSLRSAGDNHEMNVVDDALPDGDVYFADADRALLVDIIASVTNSDLSQRSHHLSSKLASDDPPSVGPTGSTQEALAASDMLTSGALPVATKVDGDRVPSTSAQVHPHPNDAALNAVLPVPQNRCLLASEYSRETFEGMICLDGTYAQSDPDEKFVPKPETAMEFFRRLLESFSEPLRAAVFAEMASQPFQAAYNADRPCLPSNGVRSRSEVPLAAKAGQNEVAEQLAEMDLDEAVGNVPPEPVEVPVSMDRQNVAVVSDARDEVPNNVTPPVGQPPVSHPSNVISESEKQNQEPRSPVTRPKVKLSVVFESEFDIYLRRLLDPDVDVADLDKLASDCMKALDASVPEDLLRRPEYEEPVLGDSSDDETFSVNDLIDDAIATVSEEKKEEDRRSHEEATKEAQARVTEPISAEKRNKTKPVDQDVLDAIADGMEAHSSDDGRSESDDEWSERSESRRPESEEERDPLAYSSDSGASESEWSDQETITKFMDHFMSMKSPVKSPRKSRNMSIDPESDEERKDLSRYSADEDMPPAADVALDNTLLSQEEDVDEEAKKRREAELRTKCKFISEGCQMSDEKLTAELAALFGEDSDGTASKNTKSGNSSARVGSGRPSRSRGMRTLSLSKPKPPRKQVKEDEEPSASDSDQSFGAPRPSKSPPKPPKRLLDSSSSDSDVSMNLLKRPRPTPKPAFIDISSDEDEDYRMPEVFSKPKPKSSTKKITEKRKPVRPPKRILKDTELVAASRKAIGAEEDRKSRLTDLPDYDGGVLDKFEDDLGAPMEIKVCETLWDQMRPHQQQGVRFMYRSVIESYEYSREHAFGGCILAHSMGLGKTLQVLAFLQACLSSEALNLDTALVICPASTVLNWQDECERWMKFVPRELGMKAYELVSGRIEYRLETMKEWKSKGGVLMISYPMYTSMVNEKLRKNERPESKKLLLELLQDPGPDVVVCDEAHELKNEKSARSQAVNLIATQARIALTGTPMQNNLGEYYTMVNFIKPDLLGSRKEFTNRFAEPINAGSRKDADSVEKLIMKKRSHILHETLSACLDLKGVSILTETLPPKSEHVIRVRMSQLQIDLYKAYIQSRDLANLDSKKKILPPVKTVQLLAFHPHCIRQEEENERRKAEEYSGPRQQKPKAKNASRDSDDSEDDTADLDENNRTWFDALLPSGEDFDVGLGPKVEILRELVIESVKRKEKMLVFSDRKAILLLVWKLLQKIHREKIKLPDESILTMEPGRNFLLLDGTTPVMKRREYINKFNKKDDCHVFLLSIKAAGMGVNLVGASRVVLLEPMWNPTVDRQALFRTYRYGQTKPVHVYRLVTAGICEEKIFELQMNKQAMFQRVLEKKFGRGFDRIGPDFFVYHDNTFKKAWIPERPPGDDIVVRLLEQFPHHVVQTQNFDSLLEPTEQPLSFDESVLAWAEFEIEKEKNSADHMWVALFDRKEVADEMNARKACDFVVMPVDVDSLKAFVSSIVRRLLQKKRNVGSFMEKFRSAKSVLENAITAAQLRERALHPVYQPASHHVPPGVRALAPQRPRPPVPLLPSNHRPPVPPVIQQAVRHRPPPGMDAVPVSKLHQRNGLDNLPSTSAPSYQPMYPEFMPGSLALNAQQIEAMTAAVDLRRNGENRDGTLVVMPQPPPDVVDRAAHLGQSRDPAQRNDAARFALASRDNTSGRENTSVFRKVLNALTGSSQSQQGSSGHVD